MMNALAEFFSPEAGQARRQWLNRQEDRVGNALAGYLGPAAQPIQSAALLAGYLSPGADMMEAADASRGMWNADNPLDAAVAGATMLGATGMMFLPGNFNALQEGVGSVADDLVRAYDPAVMRAGMGPVSETPAQEVARLLREGRAHAVTDALMARVDPDEMVRLYESGATGVPMPMDDISRLARAHEMGLGPEPYMGMPYLHGTNSEIEDLMLGFDQSRVGSVRETYDGFHFTTDPSVAREYGGNILEAYLPVNRKVFDVENPDDLRFLTEAIGEFDGFSGDELAAQIARSYGGPIHDYGAPDIHRAARMDNAEGIALWDGYGHEQAVVFDANRIRSPNARFDPRLAHLANLSAGIGGVAVGLNALAPTQENADRQVILDWLDSQGL